ncbi:hypothetical protein GLOIN_2v1763333 [Rhizophagus irregularis DAOM 181602=DAOM 197198]|nr:hypothetical protein GLOIN_2v1763333 [Rhizophagus irregularis DAOM 181602=DAOM 197198]
MGNSNHVITVQNFFVNNHSFVFDDFLGNFSLIPIFQHFDVNSIHWALTKDWIQHNSTSDICSECNSAYQAFKTKSLNYILPCGDVLLKHYPNLYPDSGKPCPICSNHPETNNHLGFCANLIPFINSTLKNHKNILISFIDSHTQKFYSLILDSVNHYTLFDDVSGFSHEIYLILHQLVPQSLYDLVNSFTFNMKSTHSIIFEFFLPIQQILYKTIWPQHNSLLRAWERTQGIIKRKNDMLDVLLRTVHLRPLLPISEPSRGGDSFTS